MKSEIAFLTLATSLALVGFTGYDVTSARPLLNQITRIVSRSIPASNQLNTCRTDLSQKSSPLANCRAVSRLKNATYRLPKLGNFRLRNGVYENEAKNQRVVLVDQAEKIAIGDLTRNGEADAAVLLTAKTGRSRSFVYLAAATNANGTPKQVSSVLLGDRVKVQSVEINSAYIKVDLLTRRPQDPLCCPTKPVTQFYALGKNGLTRLPKSALTKKSTQMHPLFQASLRPTDIGCG
jgi:hypothetical protein